MNKEQQSIIDYLIHPFILESYFYRDMPKHFKSKNDPYTEVRLAKGLEKHNAYRFSNTIKCPYCGSNTTHPLKNIETDGFLQFKCSECLSIFGKKI